jgi:hypothetical protein
MKVKKNSLFGLILVLVMLVWNVANAATYGPVTPSLISRDGPVNDGNDSAADLNVNNYFGVNTWSEIARIEIPEDDTTSTGFSDDPLSIGDLVRNDEDELISGSWSLDATVWQSFASVMLVLNDGNVGNIFWTAWLLTPGSTFGHWMTQVPDGTFKGLSHITAYASPDAAVVPVPAAVWLFGSGLASLLGAARRKSAAAQA